MSDDWFNYVDRKTGPKPSHQRTAPAAAVLKKLGMNDHVPEVEKASRESMVVEESDASPSMILRILGKIRGQ